MDEKQVAALKRNNRINAIIIGLTTDDPEHKQYILEELLREETNEVEFKDMKARERWEDPKFKKL